MGFKISVPDFWAGKIYFVFYFCFSLYFGYLLKFVAANTIARYTDDGIAYAQAEITYLVLLLLPTLVAFCLSFLNIFFKFGMTWIFNANGILGIFFLLFNLAYFKTEILIWVAFFVFCLFVLGVFHSAQKRDGRGEHTAGRREMIINSFLIILGFPWVGLALMGVFSFGIYMFYLINNFERHRLGILIPLHIAAVVICAVYWMRRKEKIKNL